MSMRVSLIIDGDHKGARAAVAATESDLKKLGTAAADTQGKLNTLKPPVQPVQGFRQEVKLTEQQLAQMQFQLNDMAVGFASGQSPFTIMTQQGMQMSQMFRSGTGVMGALRAVGGGIAQFVSNPLNLAVLGAGVAATALAAVATSITSNWPSANAVIEKHQSLVKSIGENWDNNLKRMKAYSIESRNTMLFEAMMLTTSLEKAQRAAFEGITAAGGKNTGGARIAGVSQTAIMASGSKELQDASQAFFSSVKNGRPDVMAFREQLSLIGQASADKEVQRLVASMMLQTEAAAQAQQELARNRDLVSGLRGNQADLNRALGESADKVGTLTGKLGDLSKGLAFAAAQQGFGGPARTAASSQNAFYGKELLNLIGAAEGTDQGRGYNETLGYGKFTGGDVDLVTMKLSEVLDLQARMLAHPENSFNSSAVGRYQITRQNIREFMPQLGLTPDMVFSPKVQDQIALALANRTGGDVGKMNSTWVGLQKVSPVLTAKAFESSMGERSGVADSMVKVDRKEDATALKDAEAAQKRLNSANERWSQLLREGQTQLAARNSALGKSVYEQARLTREEQLWTQARATFGDRVDQDRKLFAKLTEEITKQADAYGKLAEAKMQDEKFAAGREQMERQQIQRWDQIRSVGGGIVSTLIQSREQGMSWGSSLNSVLDSVKKKGLDLLESVFNNLAFGQQGSNNGGALGGFTGLIGNLIGSFMAPQSIYAQGAAFAGNAQAFASGAGFSNSVVTRPTYFGFGGGKLGLMAEEKPEAVMPLTNGMEVRARGASGDTSLPLTRMADGSLGVDMRGGAQRFAMGGVFASGGGSSGATTASGVPKINFIINNTSGQPATGRQTQNADGSIDIEAFVGEAVNKHIAGGRADGPIGARFGMKPRGNTNV